MTLYAGRYEEIKYLGKGSSGEVKHVVDTKTGQQCALKTLRDRSHDFLFSFRAEFETLKKINHPNIAKVYDTGRDPETKSLFFTCEFVDGKDLYDATEGLNIDVIEDLFVQALRALNYLHQFGIVHYDIKPQNFLVHRLSGGLKLIDFGFSNYYRRQRPQNSADSYQVVGTAAYVAPEIIQGQKSDHRSDLYSLACTFYKIFTRDLPFQADTEAAVHHCHVHAQAASPSSRKKEIPHYIDAILLKLMSKNPDDRYASASAVIEDLNILSGKNYPIETHDTLMSYIPTSGILVGRDAVCLQFESLYKQRILADPPTSPQPYFVLVGAQGLGKSRLLDHFKSYAQKDFVTVLSWRDFEGMAMDEIKYPCLVLGDDVPVTTDDLDYISFGFESDRLMVVLATDRDVPCHAKAKATLTPLTLEQTREAVQKTTGITNIPDAVISRLHALSGGIPLYLVYTLQALLEKGLLKDEFGSWSDSMVDDLSAQIDGHDTSTLVREHLAAKIKEASLVESDWDLLATLALTGEPTMTELSEITNAGAVEDELKSLIDKGILRLSTNHQYEFAHPLINDLILTIMPDELLEMFCNQIADEMEIKGADKEKILYFRSFGKYDKALKALIELAELHHNRSDYQPAIDFLKRALDKSTNQATRQDLLFKMATWQAEVAEYHESNLCLDLILADQKLLKPELLIQCMITHGINDKNLGNSDKARDWYAKAELQLSQNPVKWLAVLLFNKQARLAYEKGDITNAETLYAKAWAVWQNELDPNEQLITARSDRDELLVLQNRLDEAQQILTTALEKLEAFKSHVNHVILRIKLARIYIAKKNIDEAEALLKDCLTQLKSQRIVKWLYIIYNDLADIAQKKDHNEESLNYLRHAFNLAHKLGSPREFYHTAYNLAAIYLKLGKMDEAKKYHEFVVSRLQVIVDGSQPSRQEVLLYFYALLGMIKLEKIIPKQSDQGNAYSQRVQDLIAKYDYLAALKSQFDSAVS